MTREMQRRIRESKQRAKTLVRFANPRTRKRPTTDEVMAIICKAGVPFQLRGEVVDFKVNSYSSGQLIRAARYTVTVSGGRQFLITAYQHMAPDSPEEKALDAKLDLPSGLYNIFSQEIEN